MYYTFTRLFTKKLFLFGLITLGFLLPVAQAAATKTHAIAVSVNHSGVPVITVSTVSGSISACAGTASASPFIQQFTVSGTVLTANIVATAPTGFEVSLALGTGYGPSVTLTPGAGTVLSTTVFVRSAASAAAGTISGNVGVASTGATSQNVAVTGTVNALPTVNTVTNQVLAANTATTAVNFTGTANTFNWVNDTPGIGLAASGTGNIGSFTAVNNSSSPITATITATPLNAGFAYIVNETSNNVSVINIATNKVTATIPVGANPYGVSVSPDGSRVYVANIGSNNVSVINTATNTVITTIAVGSLPYGVSVSPDGSRVYVTNNASNNVSVINTATNTVITTIAIGSLPYGVSVSPDGSRVYVANESSNNVSVINTATNTVTATIAVGTSPLGVSVSPDGSRVYVANNTSNNVSVINTATNTVTATIDVGTQPEGVSVSPDGSSVYVANYGSNNVSVINTATNTVTATIAVGVGPIGVSVSPDGSRVYVANYSSNNVSVINTATNTVTNTVTVGTHSISVGNFITPGISCPGTPVNFTITVNPATPTTRASTLTFTNTAATVTTASWTNGNGAARAVFMFAGSTGSPAPVNLTAYNANTVFGTGDQIGTSGWYCVYNGTGSTVNVTGLTAGATYRVMTVEYNGTGSSAAYLTTAGAGNPANITLQLNITAGTATGSISACAGNASASPAIQQFTVSGSSLSSNITATAPAGFEVSLAQGSGFGATVSLTPVSGTVTSTTVYVRSSASAAVGAISGNVVLSATSATSQNVAVTGTVNALPTVSTVTNQVLAANTATTAVNFTGTANTFNWVNDTPGIGLAASGTGNIASFTVANNASSPITATITATPLNAGFAYIPNANSNNVSVIKTATNTVIATMAVGVGPFGVSVSPDGSSVYVVNQGSNNVSVINTATNTVITTIAVGSVPTGISVSPDGSRVYVANQISNNVSVINTATNTVTATIAVGTQPYGVSVSPDGSRVFVTNTLSNNVSVINTATNTVIATIVVGTRPQGVSVSPDGSRVYVANNTSNTVSVINTATNTVIANKGVGTRPMGVSVSPDGSRVYVANNTSNNVSVINTATNTVITTIAVGNNPEGVSVSPDGSSVYVANFGSNNVSVINTATNTVTNTVTVGASPTSVGNFVGPGIGCSGSPVRFTITVNPATPTTQASNLIFTNTAATTTTASWTNGNGTARAVFMFAGTTGSPAPVNLTAYNANTVFGTGDQIGTSGWFCVYNGAGTTVNVTGLTAGTTYQVMAVEYNGTGSSTAYLTTAGTGNPNGFVTTTPAVISATGTLVSLNTQYGSASPSASFNVAGTGMADVVLITPPTGFEVSTDNSTFAPTVTVGTIGNFDPIPVYTRLSATSPAGAYSGNIVLTSSGAAAVNFATLLSTVNPAYLFYNAAPVTINAGDNIPALTGTVTGFVSPDTQGSVTTGTLSFTTTATSSSPQGSYAITGSGLTPNSNYLFLQNKSNNFALTINAVVFVAPATTATNETFTGTTTTSTTVNWTNGNGTARAVFMFAGTTGSPSPVDLSAYNANTVFGTGDQIGTSGWFCVYNGTGSTVNVTGLTAGTAYQVMTIEYNGAGSSAAYLTTTGTGNPASVTTISPSTAITSINTASSNPSNATSVQYTATFDALITGLSTSNFSLTTTGTIGGASITSVTGSGTTYTVTVNTGTGDGTITLNLANSAGLSPGISTILPFAGQTYTIDKTAPTNTISTPSATITKNTNVTYTVTYADANFNSSTLVTGNITLNKTGTANGTVGVSGSGTTRTVTISGITGDGTLGISIAAGTGTDLATNTTLTAGPSTTFTVDNTAPKIAIGAPSVSSTSSGPVTYTVTYSDANFNSATLATGDITLNKTGTANGTVGVVNSGTTSTVTITGITGTGTLGISIAAGTASDLAGNLAPGYANSTTFSVAPVVSVNVTAINTTTSSPTNATSLQYTVIFDTSVSGLSTSNFSLTTTGTALGSITGLSGSGTTYTVTITSVTGDGNLTLNFANTAGVTPSITTTLPFAGQTYTIDNTAPTLAFLFYEVNSRISSSVVGVGRSVSLGFDTNEPIQTATATIAGHTVTVFSGGGKGNSASYTMTSGDTEGRVPFSLTITDLAGNSSTYTDVSQGDDVEFDMTPPTVTISAPSASSTTTGPVSFTVTYADANFDASTLGTGDITLNTTGGATGTVAITGSGLTRTVTISSITGTGTIGISIAAGTATDLAGNSAPGAGPSATFTTGVILSSDATLSNITTNIGTLSPAFSPGVLNYTVNVLNTMNAIRVTPTANDPNATIKIAGALVTSGTQTPFDIPLSYGSNNVVIKGIAQDGVTKVTYTLNVVRSALSSDAFLSNLVLSSGTIQPAFTPSVHSYAVSVPNTTAGMTIIPTVEDATATVMVNGSTVTSGSPSLNIPLNVGANAVTTVVTAQNGITTQTYTVTVTRLAPSTDATLSSITTNVGTLSPAFSPGTLNYTVNVINTMNAIRVTPTVHDPNATVKVAGAVVTSGTQTPFDIPLSYGSNNVVIKGLAQDGVTKITYTINVIRSTLASDAFLSNLALSAGTITPGFAPSVFNYTASVPNATSSMTVTPTEEDPTVMATIKVNGNTIASGSPATIPLNVGDNTITTVVTAQNGINTFTYTTTVTRASSTGLSSRYQTISVNPSDSLRLANADVIVHPALSPNGDGINDFLYIENIQNHPENKVTLINRSGSVIFEISGYDNYSKVFNGHSSVTGALVQPGTYYYLVEYAQNGENKRKTGFFVLK